jgi:Zn-dependent alcohol dehydrogenase
MSAQVVLITGGLTGIGRAAALAFAQKGAKVVVAGRRDEAGKALVRELRAFGSEAEFINADVRKEDDVRALVDKTVARFGRLDVAVNNAGTEGRVGPITDQTAESYAATFDTNVLGVILSMKHEVRVMQGQGSGSIINISHLGMAVAGFPNLLFVYGPQSPNSFCNGPTCAELQGDWIARLLDHLRQRNYARIEATVPAEEAWRTQVLALADATLFPRADSWYLGANIPGKPREMLAFTGGLPAYLAKCRESAERGYEGFAIS